MKFKVGDRVRAKLEVKIDTWHYMKKKFERDD